MQTDETLPPMQLDLALRRPGPQTYEVYFRNDLLWATREIEAETPEQALAIAQKLAVDDLHSLHFEYYESSDCEVAEIEVCDDDGISLALWRDGDLHLRMAAHDLLEALQVLCDLPANDSGERTIPAGFLDQAHAAIAKATGGAP
jgi:hypothetical protein